MNSSNSSLVFGCGSTHRDSCISGGTWSSWQPWTPINTRKTLEREQAGCYFRPDWATLYNIGMALAVLTLSPFSPFTLPEGSKGAWPGGPGRPSGPLGPSLPGKPSRPCITNTHMDTLLACTIIFNKIQKIKNTLL